MGLLGVEGNLAWFCNLDSQLRLCELAEEPGFKSRTGEVSFPASYCLPSWWPPDAHTKVPKRPGKEERTHRAQGLCDCETHSTGGPSLWQVICGEGGGAVPKLGRGQIHDLLSLKTKIRGLTPNWKGSLGLWCRLLSLSHFSIMAAFRL